MSKKQIIDLVLLTLSIAFAATKTIAEYISERDSSAIEDLSDSLGHDNTS